MHEERSYPTLRAGLVLVALGLPGVLALLFVLPGIEGVPRPLLVLNPLILLVVSAFAGAWATRRVGLRSRVVEHVAGRDYPQLLPPEWARMVGIGIAAGLVIGPLDHLTRALWQVSADLPPSLLQAWQPSSLLIGVLYGGVVEEVMMRWGLMSLVILGLWRVAARGAAVPPAWTVWIAVVVAALAFAAGHLPTLAAAGIALEPALVLRTLVWNALLGLVFGVLFARRELESAMLAHAGFHAGIVLPALLLPY